MEEQEARARELYSRHYGSLLDMHREGKYEEYKSYGIAIETETEWITAMIRKYTAELSMVEEVMGIINN